MKTAIGGLCLLVATLGQAQTPQGVGMYLEAGEARHDGASTDAMTLGVRVPTDVRFFSGRLALSVDGYASRWHADALPGERDNFTQLGLVPMLRWRFDEGRSPWFVEGGIGVSYLVNGYRTRNKEFSTRWNFSDHLGVGYSFGRHEIGVYLKHVSNAGFKDPNPGETFYQLRYGYTF